MAPDRGPGLELAPYADVFPAATRPVAAPFSAQTLQAAFQLEIGKCNLPDVSAWPLAASRRRERTLHDIALVPSTRGHLSQLIRLPVSMFTSLEICRTFAQQMLT